MRISYYGLVETKHGRKKRVLVIDDERPIVRFVTVNLSVAGYETRTASSGEEALRLARTRQPDIIFLDIFIPRVSGFDGLKGLGTFTYVPILVFSSSPTACEKALECGADDFICKPFKPEQLEQKIQTLFTKRRR